MIELILNRSKVICDPYLWVALVEHGFCFVVPLLNQFLLRNGEEVDVEVVHFLDICTGLCKYVLV